MKQLLIITGTVFLFLSSIAQTKITQLIFNAKVYTMDKDFTIAEAIAIKDGKIVATGRTADLRKNYKPAKTLDAKGRAIYPGFIDAHAHFYGYGLSLLRVNLMGTTSWQDVVMRTDSFRNAKHFKAGEWILGRGWDQNDWDVKEFPDKTLLDSIFPDNPVIITRVDGHAAMANSMALAAAGIKPGQKLTGGDVVVKVGKLTGLLIDNAVDLVSNVVPGETEKLKRFALIEAERNCFAAGLTTVDDCGVEPETIKLIRSMHADGSLNMRIYAMLSDAPSAYKFIDKFGKIKTPRLNVRAVKVYADGALGSRGACLLEPYSDKTGHHGFLLSNPEHFDSVASVLIKKGFQMCTHAIGDSGNRTVLNIYSKYLQKGNDLRWRIEHAQVVNQNDFHYFNDYNIIPSVQPTHATSDMYWAGDRLGSMRVKNAYAYQDLLKQNNWLPLGTDFPVEDISPIKTFYAAVFRKDAKGWPASGYQTENSLSRKEALYGMTLWAAKANFEEDEKGSLEKGKFADFVMLDRDLMTADEKEIPDTKVVSTFVGGTQVYSSTASDIKGQGNLFLKIRPVTKPKRPNL